MRVEYVASARRDLNRIPKADQRLILAAVDIYARIGTGDVRALKARPGYRLRVRDWRVLFDLDSNVVTVRRVVRRSERTYR